MKTNLVIVALSSILLLVGCATHSASGASSLGTEQARKPSIILIVADDLSLLDLSTYGKTPISVPTPNLDRLAKRGVTFRRGYSTASVCSPSRAALMTGQYQQRYGFEFLTPEGPDGGGQGLAENQRVFVSDLKVGGYRTAMLGKWHLGSTNDRLPTTRGFDQFFGFLAGETAYAEEKTPGLISVAAPYVGKRSFTRSAEWIKLMSDLAGDNTPPKIENDDQSYLTDLLTRKAVEFIRSSGQSPYFLYLAHLAPHTPYQALEADVANFTNLKDPLQRTYAAMISSLDRSVGAVLDAVEASGAGEDTLIIFTADNGAATYMGVSDCETLAGGKLSYFEGGARIPLIISWPRKWPSGRVDSRNVSQLDLAPTILAAAKVDAATRFDGRDLTPLMTPDRQSETVHETLFWRTGAEYAVLSGDLKLLSNTRQGAFPWLFDLSSDPRERKSLTFERRSEVANLQRRYNDWAKSMRQPAWPSNQVVQVFQCGRISFHEQ
ncbi:MAG: sulfatase-like hydrolase/transferase [Rhodocyclaceae bacterium]|nr:sulfatase-like hydrolase/transferase [Rhodocyclaceae bacterium]